jgi:DNA-3-methyladenine glycosylase II
MEDEITLDTKLVHTTILKIASINHPRIAALIEKNGCIEFPKPKFDCILTFLANTVISQQLSSRAAETIWNRICNLAEQLSLPLEEVFQPRYAASLLDCGVSRTKAKALIGMTRSYNAGIICSRSIRQNSYDDIVSIVTSFWGFGLWSADMVAIFFVQDPDIWPETDAALRKGTSALVPGENFSKLAEHYRPYRSYLARHIWMGVDTGILSTSQ